MLDSSVAIDGAPPRTPVGVAQGPSMPQSGWAWREDDANAGKEGLRAHRTCRHHAPVNQLASMRENVRMNTLVIAP
jgi:hypothetical protein